MSEAVIRTLNAKQVYEAFGIPRAQLGQLVADGRVAMSQIRTASGVTNLYSVADLDRLVGAPANG